MNYSILELSNGLAKLEAEDGSIGFFKASELPDGASVNDILTLDGGSFRLNAEETEKRKKRILNLQKSLFE